MIVSRSTLCIYSPSAFRTSAAIGAAVPPPVPPVWRSTIGGDRELVGEADEPQIVGSVADLGGAGLARDVDALEPRRLAGALLDDVAHHRAELGRRVLGHHALGLFGQRLVDRAAVGVEHLLHQPRLHPHAAVADRLRDRGHLERRDQQLVLPDRHPADVDLARIGRQQAPARPVLAARHHLLVRVVHRRILVEPELLHVVAHRALAELLADLGPDGVDGVRERRREVDVAEVLAAEVVQRRPRDHLAVLAADARVGLVAAGVERGGGRDGLHRRARREPALGRAVERLGVRRIGRVERRRGRHHAHRAGLHVERDDGAGPARELLVGDLLGLRHERGAQVVAHVLRAEQALERADRVAAAAGQLVVVVVLDAGAPAVERREADRVREQLAGGVAALEALARQRPVGRQHGAVGRADDPALDPLLLEQDAAVVRVLAQRLGLEHRPARRERDEHGEQHDHEAEQPHDRRVHRSPLRPIRPAGRRARSDTSSSSASSTKFARIDEPP